MCACVCVRAKRKTEIERKRERERERERKTIFRFSLVHFLVSSFSYQKRTTVKSYQIPRSKVVRDAEVFFNVVPSSEGLL